MESLDIDSEDLFAETPTPAVNIDDENLFAETPTPEVDIDSADLFTETPTPVAPLTEAPVKASEDTDYDAELMKRVAIEEKGRAKIRDILQKNARIAKEIVAMGKQGAKPSAIQKYAAEQGYVEDFSGGYSEAIPRLAKSETFSGVDLERAIEEQVQKERSGEEVQHFSPLHLLETTIGEGVNAWREKRLPSTDKITPYDKGWMKRVEDTYNQPLINPDTGAINLEAVFKSDLSRKDQNELVLMDATRKTGVSRDLWRDILNRRFGVSEKDNAFNTTAKRAAQLLDSVALNIPSMVWARTGSNNPIARASLLKEVTPKVPIIIVQQAGKYYAQQENGALLPIRDAMPDDNENTLKQKGWAAIVDNVIGSTEQQAMENWAQLGDVVLAFTGAGGVKLAGKVGASAAGKFAAKEGAKTASKVALKTGAATERLGGAVHAVLGTPGYTIAKKLAPAAIERKIKAESKGLKLFRLLDSTVSPVVIQATGAAIGAPRGTEAEQAIGGAVLAGGMQVPALGARGAIKGVEAVTKIPLFGYVEPNNLLSLMAQEKPVWKAAIRTEDFAKLPKYPKKRFFEAMAKEKGVTVEEYKAKGNVVADYADFRKKAAASLAFHDSMQAGTTAWVNGEVDNSGIMQYYENLSNSPQGREMMDTISRSVATDNLSVQGRYRKKILSELSKASLDHYNEKSKGGATEEELKTLKFMDEGFREQISSMPSTVLNADFADFMGAVRRSVDERNGKKNLAFFSDAIENIVNSTSDKMAYTLFGTDLAKLYSAVLDSDTPLKFREVLKYINNLPDFVAEYQLNAHKYSDKTHNPIRGTSQSVVHPLKTAKALINNPDAIRDVIASAQADVQFLIGREGLGASIKDDAKGVKGRIKEKVAAYREVLRKNRIQSTLDANYLKNVENAAVVQEQKFRGQLDADWTSKAAGKVVVNKSYRKRAKEAATTLTGTDKGIAEQVARELGTRTYTPDEIAMMPKPVQDIVIGAQRALELADHHANVAADAITRSLQLETKAKEIEALQSGLGQGDLLALLSDSEVEIHEALLNMMPVLHNALKGDALFSNVIASIAKEIHDSNGTMTISNNLLGVLRMFTNADMLTKLYEAANIVAPNVTDAQWKIIQKEANAVTDMLYSIGKDAEAWRDSMKKLADIYDKAVNKAPLVAEQIRFMKDALFTMKRQRELDRLGSKLYDLVERLGASKNVSKADLKLLTAFAGGSMVERFRFYSNPDWIITRKGEVDRLFTCLKNQIPELHKLGIQLLQETMGTNFKPDSYKAAFISSWFINPTNSYGGASGNMLYTLALAKLWREKADTKVGGILRSLQNTEMLATFLSRDTAISITRKISEYGAAKSRARGMGEKLATKFGKELEAITVNGKNYTALQSNKHFVDLLKRMLMGVNNFTRDCYLVVNSEVTPQGKAVLDWVRSGYKEGVLVESLSTYIEAQNRAALRKDPNAKIPVITAEAINISAENIKTYFSNNGNKLDITAYEIAFEFAKIYQKYDREKIQIRNSLSEVAAKDSGKSYPILQYFPHRLGNGSHKSVHITAKDVNINVPSIRNNMFGRELGTSIDGQIAKTKTTANTSELLHPQEAFLFDAISLFENVLTREPGSYLQNTVRLYRDSGHESSARALMSYLMGVEGAPGESVGKLLTYIGDTVPGMGVFRVAMSTVISPSLRLVTPVKFLVENALQTFSMGVGSNPRTIRAEIGDILKIFPLYMVRLLERVSKRQKRKDPQVMGELLTVQRFLSHSPSPEYQLIISDLLQGLNPEYSAKTQQVLKRINWNSPMWKRIDKKIGDPSQEFFGGMAGYTKEVMESSLAEQKLVQASAIWQGLVEDATKLKREGKSQAEVTGVMYNTLHATYEGVLGSNVGAMDAANALTSGVFDGRPLEGFAGFAAEYTNRQIGRFDADNLPSAIKALARWKPGAAQFYNPMTNGLYRIILGAHAVGGGSGVTNRVTATVSIIGLTAMAGALIYLAGETGSQWATRISAVPVPSIENETLLEWVMSMLTNPFASRGSYGAMEVSTYTELIATVAKLSINEMLAQGDGTFDVEAHEKEQRALVAKMWELALPTTLLAPANFFITDILDVPSLLGFAWLNLTDIEEATLKAQEMLKASKEAEEYRVDKGGVDNSMEFIAMLNAELAKAVSLWAVKDSMVDMTPDEQQQVMGQFTHLGKMRLKDEEKEIKQQKKDYDVGTSTASQDVIKQDK